MLTYSFEGNADNSMYAHLYRCIRDDICEGRLSPGVRLPSKREFSKHLGVSLIVIENAYAQLGAEGYIRSAPRKGYFVEDMDRMPAVTNVEATPDHEFEKTSKATPLLADLATSAVDVEMFPFATWARALRNVMVTEDERELLLDSPAAGLPALRGAIARHLHGFRGIEVDPRQIVIGAGTQFLYQMLVQLLGRDAPYAIEDPGYSRLGKIYEANGAQVSYLPMDDAGIRVDELVGSGASVVHVMPSHQFPSGTVMPISRRYELLSWASEIPGRYIVEDDHDCEFRLVGRPIPTLQSIDLSGRVIYINTFSRSLASTFRISYMILPTQLAERFDEKLGFYSCSVSNFEQLALARFMDEGHFSRHLAKMRSHYRCKRDLLIEGLNSGPLGPHIAIRRQECGLHFLMQVDTSLSDTHLVANAAEHGVAISCLSSYQHIPEDRSHVVVVNYSGVEKESIPGAVTALSHLLDR